MSTFTAPGPALSLFGPIPKPPMFGLLEQLRRLYEDDPTTGLLPATDHFGLGANFWMYPCDAARPFDPCGTGTFATKEDGDENAGAIVKFMGFTVYAAVTCSTISMGDYAGFSARIERVFEAVESAAIAYELAQGTAIESVSNVNPHFGDADKTLPAGGSAVAPEVGLRWLEWAIGQSQRAGVIHAPPEVAAAWRYDELTVDQQGILRTLANGTPVIADPGYQETHPDSVGAPSSGTSWAYATGPLQVMLGEEVRLPDDPRQAIDRSDNVVTVRPERDVLASFDPCVQAAVLIDWTP